MSKFTIFTVLSLALLAFSFDANAAHCSGGHKEIKETSDTMTEDSNEDEAN